MKHWPRRAIQTFLGHPASVDNADSTDQELYEPLTRPHVFLFLYLLLGF